MLRHDPCLFNMLLFSYATILPNMPQNDSPENQSKQDFWSQPVVTDLLQERELHI